MSVGLVAPPAERSSKRDLKWTRFCRRGCASAVLLLGFTVAACNSPLKVEGLEPFDPPFHYRTWWGQLEECAGQRGDFDEIRWFTGRTVILDGKDAFGAWSSPNKIVLERFYTKSERLVKHEMLHHLTNGDMPHSHPAFAWCTTTVAPPQPVIITE